LSACAFASCVASGTQLKVRSQTFTPTSVIQVDDGGAMDLKKSSIHCVALLLTAACACTAQSGAGVPLSASRLLYVVGYVPIEPSPSEKSPATGVHLPSPRSIAHSATSAVK